MKPGRPDRPLPPTDGPTEGRASTDLAAEGGPLQGPGIASATGAETPPTPHAEPEAVWGTGASLALGLALLLAYLLFQGGAMVLVAILDLLIQGESGAGFQAHLRARMGWLFSVATLLAAPAASALAVAWTMAGAHRRTLDGAERGRAVRRHLGLRAPGWMPTLLWIVVTAALLATYEAAALALDRPPLPDFIVEFYGTGSPWLLAAAVVLGAPLVEEVIFRGFLLPGLAAGPLRPAGAVVLTAVLWAAIHGQYDVFDMAAVFCLGLAFGASRLHSGSLWLPLLLHAAVNGLAMVQVFAALG